MHQANDIQPQSFHRFNASLLWANSSRTQSTNYTPLFTNATFAKTVNVSLPVGTEAASANAANGAATHIIPIVVPPGTNDGS
ncbi:MAG: hypothetical protein KIS77_15980 [Saprospiraceae bacterium]|nr:hypothetical protein [Saprospiraceae bacterium]